MWKDIPEYEGLYQINEDGDVRSIKNGIIRNKAKCTMPTGYQYVSLWKNNKIKNNSIHRLVAKTFIPNPYNLPIVMHLDNNPSNNNVNNLKWGTFQENTIQAYNDGLISTQYNHNPYRFYEIYKDDGTVHEICDGYQGVLDKIGYGTIATVHNAVSQKGKLRYGPYKGCRICKIIFEDKK